MTMGSITRRWARALFLLGEEQGNLTVLVKEVRVAADAWEVSEELRVAMTNFMLEEKTRRAIWEALVGKLGMSRPGRNFMMLLFDKRRVSQLSGIARELQALADERENRVRAEVVSATRIGDDMVDRLASAIRMRTGKTVLVTRREDPALIGGIVTRVGDLLYDGSVRTQLERMKERMLNRAG